MMVVGFFRRLDQEVNDRERALDEEVRNGSLDAIKEGALNRYLVKKRNSGKGLRTEFTGGLEVMLTL